VRNYFIKYIISRCIGPPYWRFNKYPKLFFRRWHINRWIKRKSFRK